MIPSASHCDQQRGNDKRQTQAWIQAPPQPGLCSWSPPPFLPCPALSPTLSPKKEQGDVSALTFGGWPACSPPEVQSITINSRGSFKKAMCILACTHTHNIHTHTQHTQHTHTHTTYPHNIHIHTHTTYPHNIHTHTQHTQICTHSPNTYVPTQSCTYIHTHVYIHTYTQHTNSQIYTYTYTPCIYTHMQHTHLNTFRQHTHSHIHTHNTNTSTYLHASGQRCFAWLSFKLPGNRKQAQEVGPRLPPPL